MPDALLQATNINKSFGKRQVLRDVCFAIEPNRMIAIKGPSGAGKTTLLQVLAGILAPDSGTVAFEGRPYAEVADKERFRNENFGFVFQNALLIETMTVLENVLLPGLFSARLDPAYAAHLLEMAGIADLAHTNVRLLSEGERQRCAICRGLLGRPRLLFADEPTGYLDADNTQRTIHFLQALSQTERFSCIVVTHDGSIDAYFDSIFNLD